MASSSSKPNEEDALEEDALDAMGRKVWDKDFYVERAKNNIMFGPERIGRRKDPVIPLPSSQRTYLKQRTVDLQLDKNLGKTQVVTAHTIKPMQGGFWCSVCECLLKDSSTYLEHVNGRRHNRNLGMNMKVEKIGVDRVREKLKAMRKEPEEEEAEDIAARIQRMEEEQEEKKLRKKENKKKKKGAKRGAGEGGDGEGDEPSAKKPRGEDDGEEDDDEEEEETEEQKMLKMMGLPTGFG
mmetsp:Transcript_43944/g.118105  ORF Transcript_43944/g.118105 Transcript_43944/m.118105 type:complete len:239 (+) Transcript_43944:96-812(+)